MVFIKHRRWVIGTVLLIGVMLFNLPTNPNNGEVLMDGRILFDWIGQASYAYVDDNNMFTSPVIVNKGAILELEPGVYYWKVSGLGIVNQFKINSLLGIDIRQGGNKVNVKNTGNEDADIQIRSSGTLTGSFVLEKEDEKNIDDMKNIEVIAKAAEND